MLLRYTESPSKECPDESSYSASPTNGPSTEHELDTMWGGADLSDEDLLDAWIDDKEAAALHRIVQRYGRMVLSVCRCRAASAVDADDAYQTTFLYLAKNAHKIRHPDRLAGWLHRVAQRAALASIQAAHTEVVSIEQEPPSQVVDPFTEIGRRHDAVLLNEELSELPEHYRSAIVLHLYEGCTIEQLAARMQTTAGAVRGWLQRGKKMLRARLRRRGVVPSIAFATVASLMVDQATADAASHCLVDPTGQGSLPEPPIDQQALDALGASSPWFASTVGVTTSVLSGAAVIAVLATVHFDESAKRDSVVLSQPQATVRSPSVLAQFGNSDSGDPFSDAGDPFGVHDKQVKKAKPSNPKQSAESAAVPPTRPGTVWVQRPAVPQSDTFVAEQVREKLDDPVDVSVEVPLVELEQVLSNLADLPVLVDSRALDFAELDPAKAKVSLIAEQIPLRTALRKLLQPHGLKAEVQDEGLVITADPEVLVHRGIGVSRWVGVEQSAVAAVEEKLNQASEIHAIESPLGEVLEQLSEQHDLAIVVDTVALDEIGVDVDAPVTFRAHQVKLEDLLASVLSPLDLTYTIQNSLLTVTTHEAASESSRLLGRVYWLEGTGLATDDVKTIVDLIQTSLQADQWEILGGNSTISILEAKRPALMISTTYRVHRRIEDLMRVLRETHFGVAPVMQAVEVPASVGARTPAGGFGGGMGGMGGGGGGMGGGGFF